jgi:ABC-type multidrug transport system ATPase subunit
MMMGGVVLLLAAQSFAGESGTELEWADLSFSTGGKTILHPCSGRAAPGRLLAIMGPSGSGKTTLLNALAGNVRMSKKASLVGTLLCDGAQCGGAAQVQDLRLAYVQQEDIFYTQMTVRETLLFAARLRLPSDVPLEEKERRVDELIELLDLRRAADTVIGDVRRRGISGGERKRLSIGCELLSEPSLLFLDERAVAGLSHQPP